MDKIMLIVFLSMIMWYIIDRFKEMWMNLDKGKYITVATSAVLAFGITFGFDLDIISALELFPNVSITGNILTALLLMSGSSAVSEIIAQFRAKSAIKIDDTKEIE